MTPTIKFIRCLLSAAAVLALVGCGATSAPGATAVASPTPNLAGARAAALKIIVPIPGAPGVWGGCSQINSNFAACPFAPELIARLNYLSSTGYFGDAPPSGVCGEDYITGTQNGLFVAPQILSETAHSNGSVSVAIQRGSQVPNFTATLSSQNGTWLATDLASGTGQAASIFSAKPNC